MTISRLAAATMVAWWCLVCTPAAEPQARLPTIGFISGSSVSAQTEQYRDAFREALRGLGYVEGRTVAIEYRWADFKYERLPGLADDLVERKVDVLLAVNAPALEATARATKTIPIVTTVLLDPAAAGLVTSLGRPGGNITGLSLVAPEVVGKQVDLLKEVVPALSRLAVLANRANPGTAPQLKAAEEAARTLGVRLHIVEARSAGQLESAFASIARERADAVLVLVDAALANSAERIAALALRHRLPVVYGLPAHARAGGLLAYGVELGDLYRRAATYVDKILKGARPADLPVEQPTKFELVVNMKTAKALGVSMPPTVLLRADTVIE
jgi:ABC-type uncharacterized transport system substrate-binding protein